MSGDSFVSSLQRLGFEQAIGKDGKSFDWMFEDRVLSPFLEWFCENLQETNLISGRDAEEFRKMKEHGILAGRQLEDALQNLSISEDSEMTEEMLEEEIKQLENDLRSKSQRKNILLLQRNKLSLHHAAMNDRISKMDKVLDGVNKRYKTTLEQCHSDNSKINTCLSNLTCSVSDLTSLYQNSAMGTSVQQKSVFLSHLNLEDYYKGEEKFTKQLHLYTKKQFFEGIAEMTGDRAGTRYEFLEVSNPVDLLVRGEKEDVSLDDCKGLARLQSIYPTSECQRINSLIEEKGTQAGCQCAEEKLRSLRDKPYPRDISELSNKLQDAQNTLSLVRRDVDLLTLKELPALIKDSCTQQVTKVLRGNYDLKIARQDYFISNQDQLIKQLVAQRARNEFLTMSYEVESKGHRDTHRLLTSATMLLQDSLNSYKDRLVMLEDPSLSSKRHQRGTVDSREKSTSRLCTLLDTEENHEKKQLYYTYAGLTENSEKHRHHLSSLRASLSSNSNTHDDKLAILEGNLQTCESLIYSTTATTSGPPSLSPQPIVDTLTQLDAMLKKLEQAVMGVIKELDQKRKVLKTDPMKNTERELFVYFFNDPDKLRRAIRSITSQLQAQLVK